MEPQARFFHKLRGGVAGLGSKLLVLALIYIFITSTLVSVDAGTIRVVKRFGGTTGRVMTPGLNIKMPLIETTETLITKKIIYETAPQDKQSFSRADYKDYPVDTNTSDGQQVDISYTIRFSIDPTKAVDIVNNVGNMNNLVEKVVKAESRVWARNIPRRYSAETLYTGAGSEEIQNAIFARLEPEFSELGLVLDSVGIREIKFSPAYVQAVERKQVEAENVKTAEFVAQRAQEEKKAEITKAEAQAESQRLLRQDLTSDIIEKLWIEKWNGELPVVMGEGNILDVSGVIR